MLLPSSRGQFQTLLDAIALSAAGDQTAIIHVEATGQDQTISRRQFADRVQSYAMSLCEAGLVTGDLVVVAHTQSLESIFAFWGCLAAGLVPSMFPTLTEKLDPAVYMESMVELVRLSDVAAVLTTDDFAPQLQAALYCPVHATTNLPEAQSPNLPISISPPSSTAFLQHSSGTTGLQKGVALSHAAVLNQIAAYSEAIALTADDVVVSWLPLYHDMGLIAGFLLPLVQGIPLVLMSPFDWVRSPALLLRAIDRYGGTLCWQPNFAYNHCARRIRQRDSDSLSLASMRLFINCSEPVRHESHELFVERFAVNGLRPEMLGVSYAMAENTFAVTQTPPGRPATVDVVDANWLQEFDYAKPAFPDDATAELRVSCGPAIVNTHVRVVDERNQPLSDRQVGELAIKSDCLLTGYHNRPDLDPFADGWYLTGDRGYMVDGEVYVIGRSKDLIINAGKNIYPQDIEAIVNSVHGVHAGRAVVFGVPDVREGTELLAVVAEVDVSDEAERREIGRAIRRAVAEQAAVTLTYVHLVGSKWLLKTSSGKIARAANRAKWQKETGR